MQHQSLNTGSELPDGPGYKSFHCLLLGVGCSVKVHIMLHLDGVNMFFFLLCYTVRLQHNCLSAFGVIVMVNIQCSYSLIEHLK